jgi:hypothetical protein
MPDMSDHLSLLLGKTSAQQGWQEPIQVATPAVGGALAIHVVPGQFWERASLVKARLNTSAVVANRFVFLQFIDPDGNVLHQAQASGAVVAGTQIDLWWSVGGIFQQGGVGNGYAPIPDLLLQSGFQIAVFVAANDIGDALTNIRMLLQRFPTDAVRADLVS